MAHTSSRSCKNGACSENFDVKYDNFWHCHEITKILGKKNLKLLKGSISF